MNRQDSRRRPLLLALALSLLPLSLAAEPDQPGAGDLDRLIADLDNESPATRDAASKSLTEAPEAAVPLLEALARDGSPEAKARAVRILHDRKVLEILRRPANAKLTSRIADVMGQDGPRRRAAIKGWVDGLARVPSTIDALIEMNAVDPNGVGGAALEALNWLCAPKATESVSGWDVTLAGPPRSAKEHLEELFSMTKLTVQFSETATTLLEQTRVVTDPTGEGLSLLDELRGICQLAGVGYRFGDDDPGVVLETAGESILWWNGWWATARKDEVALMDLGLVKRPEGASLAREEVARWMDELASKDERHCRVARAVLREVPKEFLSEVSKRAVKPHDAASDMRDRLALGKLGRLVFARWSGDRGSLVSAGLDGSGEVEISGDVRDVRFPTLSCDGTVIFAHGTDSSGRTGVFQFDPAGKAAPKRLAETSTTGSASPAGGWVAALNTADEMTLIEAGKDAPIKVGPFAAWSPQWSPDGRRVAWICRTAKSVFLFDTKDRKPREVADCLPLPQAIAWSPDGASLAVTRQTHKDGDIWEKWSTTVEILDPASGTLKLLAGPYKDVSGLCWSTDGKRVAFAATEGVAPLQATRQLLVFHVASGKSDSLPDPSGTPLSQAWLSWSPDSNSLLFGANGRKQRFWVINAATGLPTPIPRLEWTGRWAPGLDAILEANGDIRLFRRDGSGWLTLVESPESEVFPVFVPAKK